MFNQGLSGSKLSGFDAWIRLLTLLCNTASKTMSDKTTLYKFGLNKSTSFSATIYRSDVDTSPNFTKGNLIQTYMKFSQCFNNGNC